MTRTICFKTHLLAIHDILTSGTLYLTLIPMLLAYVNILASFSTGLLEIECCKKAEIRLTRAERAK